MGGMGWSWRRSQDCLVGKIAIVSSSRQRRVDGSWLCGVSVKLCNFEIKVEQTRLKKGANL